MFIVGLFAIAIAIAILIASYNTAVSCFILRVSPDVWLRLVFHRLLYVEREIA